MAENEGGQLKSVGEVAAANIAQSLGKPDLAGHIEQAIKDEVEAISTHFGLVFQDIREAYQKEIALARSVPGFVREHWAVLSVAAAGLVLIGVVIGSIR